MVTDMAATRAATRERHRSLQPPESVSRDLFLSHLSAIRIKRICLPLSASPVRRSWSIRHPALPSVPPRSDTAPLGHRADRTPSRVIKVSGTFASRHQLRPCSSARRRMMAGKVLKSAMAVAPSDQHLRTVNNDLHLVRTVCSIKIMIMIMMLRLGRNIKEGTVESVVTASSKTTMRQKIRRRSHNAISCREHCLRMDADDSWRGHLFFLLALIKTPLCWE